MDFTRLSRRFEGVFEIGKGKQSTLKIRLEIFGWCGWRFRPPQFSAAGERWDGQQPLASPSLLHDKVDFKSCAACTLFDFWSVSISDCSLYCAVFGNNWFLGAIFIVFIFESCVGVC